MPEAPAVPGVQDALALGLTQAEYELVCEKQGGPPNVVELAMYSLLWSEHCAYKHSKKLLRTLPTEGPGLVLGPGENAGAVDVGNGLVVAFKVESHNHPSAVEPFQGAATGGGGILRDIFAIGARPIAVLDSLRFGEPGERTRYLLDGAVAGIAHYGNSVGVPTVGGEVYFEGPYQQSCLVNAMALGIARRERLMRSAAAGEGNLLVLFGASTGRDGIGGASVLASAELGEDDGGKRPTVQVGDPFEGKKLLECSLQLLEDGLLVSLQDLGAAGLTSAVAEMASKGSVGVDVDVAKVPLREPDLEPFEIMVSESQERMLCVVEPHRVEEVLKVCARWEVNGAVIGEVTSSGRLRVLREGEPLGDMPVAALVDECPLYDIDPQPPSSPIYPAPQPTLPAQTSPRQTLLALLGSPNLASRQPLFEQYDPIVQSRTVRRPQTADAAVLAIEPLRGADASPDATPQSDDAGASSASSGVAPQPPLPGIAVSIDCNGRRVAADPYAGTVAAVLECAANLACVGADPLGLTNNLNFGNPGKPHIAFQLQSAVRGLRDACLALRIPVVGGNVSLYNESASGPIYPTPVIGIVGALPDVAKAGGLGFVREGDAIALVGPFSPSLSASELAKLRGEPLPLQLPPADLTAVLAAIEAVREAVRSGLLSSAHDVAEGGLAVALAECCLAGDVGARVDLRAYMRETSGPMPPRPHAAGPVSEGPPAHRETESDALLFGEGMGGFLLSGPEQALRDLAAKVPASLIGRVGGDRLLIEGFAGAIEGGAGAIEGDADAIEADAGAIDVALAEMRQAHRALGELFY